MADLAKLVVKLEADNQRLVRQLDSSKRKISRFEKSAAKSADRIGASMKRAGKVIGVGAAAAVAGLVLIINKQRELIDLQAKTAQQLDTTVASIANLERAGELGGVAMEKIATASRQLNVAIGEAIQGTAAQADAFEKLGLSAREIFDLPLDQRIAKINQALEDNVAAAEQAALAADLFGTRNGVAIRQLDPGTIAEAARQVQLFGLNLSEVDAKKVEQANDAFSTFSLLAKGITTQLTIAIAPALTALGNSFLDAAENAGGLGNAVQDAFGGMIDFAVDAVNAFDTLNRWLLRIQLTSDKAADTLRIGFMEVGREIANLGVAAENSGRKLLNFFGAGLEMRQMSAEGQRLQDGINQTADGIVEIDSKIRDALDKPLAGNAFKAHYDGAVEAANAAAEAAVKAGQKASTATASVSEPAQQAADKLAAMAQQLRQQAATADLSEGALLRYRLTVGDLSQELAMGGQAAQQYGAELMELSFALDEQAAAQARASKELSDWNEMMSEGAALAESVRTPSEKLTATYSRLNTLLEESAISQETYNRAVAQAQDDFDNASKGANQFGIDLEEIGKTLGSNIQNSLADFLFDPFADGTKSMGEQFGQLLKKMAADIAAASIMQGLFGAAGIGGGGAGGLVGAIGGLFAGARAEGGPVNAGQPFLVGERGPEMFIPASQGNIENARETSRMGGTVNVNVTTPNADSFRSNRRQISREIKQGVTI